MGDKMVFRDKGRFPAPVKICDQCKTKRTKNPSGICDNCTSFQTLADKRAAKDGK